MPWSRLARLALLILVTGCFAPRLDPCAFRCGEGSACPSGLECLADGYCHAPNQPPNCAPIVDASLFPADARPVDAEVPDARRIDARVDAAADAAPDAAPDATPDARPPADAATPPDAGVDCEEVCADPRVCGKAGDCDCGACFDDDWCGDHCVYAVCEDGRCCLEANATCDSGASQCCDGLVCVVFCVAL